jgi:hypothetical protein
MTYATMISTKSIPLLLLVVAVSLFGVIDAFYFPLSPRSVPSSTQLCGSSSDSSNDSSRGKNGKTKFGQRTVTEASRFLADFRRSNGEIIDPYKSLRVPRSATLDDIKTSYRKLSRKLHPDAVSKSRILPGNCSNLDEVREEWEKVKFSYEILSDPKARKSYDRNSSVAEVLEDPTGAVGRAVVSGAFTAVGMGFGAVWKVGELAVKAVTAQPSSPPVRKETVNNVHNKKKTLTEVVEREAPTSTENNADVTNEAKVWTIEEMRAAASAAAATRVSSNATEATLGSKKAGAPIVDKDGKEEPSASTAAAARVSSNATETTLDSLDSKKAGKRIVTDKEEPSASITNATETILDSKKAGKRIVNKGSKEEPSASTAASDSSNAPRVRITFNSTKAGTPIVKDSKEEPSASTAATASDSSNAPRKTIRITFDSKKVGTPIRKKETSQTDSDAALEIKAVSSRADKGDEGIIKMITPEPLTLTTTKTRTKKPKKSNVKTGAKGFSKK